jgi:hypothetical protein
MKIFSPVITACAKEDRGTKTIKKPYVPSTEVVKATYSRNIRWVPRPWR